MKENQIVFTKKEFGDKLWEKVAIQLSLLLEAGYEVHIYDDEPAFNIIVMEFCPDARLKAEWGSDRFVKVTAEEHEDLLFSRDSKEENSQ